jgi:hypothetical protein
MENQEDIINTFKYYIKNNLIDRIEDYINEISSDKYHNKISYPYIFQKIYLFTCIQGKRELIEFLFQVYKTFALVDRIALRPTIIYGKYLYKNGVYPVALSKDPNEY